MGEDFLKSYLVKLGFDLDATNLNKFLNLFSNARNKIAGSLPMFKSGIISATSSMVSFVAQAAISVGELVDSVARSDKEIELSAKKMWMNKEAYEAMTAATEALGYSLEDIAIDPELTNQFTELYQFTQGLMVNESMKQNLALVRDTSLEFQKFGVVAQYFFKNLGISFSNYLETDIRTLKNDLSSMNQSLSENLPMIIDKITQVVGPIMSKVISFVDRMIQKLPTITKIVESFVKLIESLGNLLSPIFSLLSDMTSWLVDKISPALDWLSGIIDKIANSKIFNWISEGLDWLNPTKYQEAAGYYNNIASTNNYGSTDNRQITNVINVQTLQDAANIFKTMDAASGIAYQ